MLMQLQRLSVFFNTGIICLLCCQREMLISAHQDQIQQLRESFKKRILEAEKWPEKVCYSFTKNLIMILLQLS